MVVENFKYLLCFSITIIIENRFFKTGLKGYIMIEERHQKIKNIHYRQFLDKGVIEPLNVNELKKALNNINGNRSKEGRALLITLYYTGARPIEVLNLKGNSIERRGKWLVINMPASKGGLPRPIYLIIDKPLIKELYNYVLGVHEEMFLFFHFRGRYVRKTAIKKGIVENINLTDKLRYYIYKWFKNVRDGGIPPYFLRHNRFSKLSINGATLQGMKQLKGCKTYESIEPYIHLSTNEAKKVGRKID